MVKKKNTQLIVKLSLNVSEITKSIGALNKIVRLEKLQLLVSSSDIMVKKYKEKHGEGVCNSRENSKKKEMSQ